MSIIQALHADESMSSQNRSAVPDEQLHTSDRRYWSSTSVVCESAEVGHYVLSSEQFWSLVFCHCGLVTVEAATRQSS